MDGLWLVSPEEALSMLERSFGRGRSHRSGNGPPAVAYPTNDPRDEMKPCVMVMV